MADEAEEESGGKKGKKDKKAKGKSNLVPAVVIAVGLILGGKMMGGAKAAPATAAGGMMVASSNPNEPMDCAVEDIKKPPKEGAVFKIDSIPINLADGHYAKVGMALQLSAAVNLEKFQAEGEAAKATDVAIGVIGGRDKAEFGSPQAMEALKEKITAEVRPKFDCTILDVLFTEFVIQ